MDSLIQTIHALVRQNMPHAGHHPPDERDLQSLDAYSRQMEDYLEVVEDMTQTLGKGVKRLRKRQRYFEALTEEAEANARQFDREGKLSLARAAAERKAAMADAARAYRNEADAQNARLLEFMDVRLQLEARLTEVNRERARLEAQLTRAREMQPA
jgi:phage shock protein A